MQEDRSGHSLQKLVKLWIKEKYHKPGNVFTAIVHRLDKPVAGIIVFAKTSKAAERLAKQFKDRLVKKVYFAIVEGNLPKDQDFLKHYIKREGNKTLVFDSPLDQCQEAILHYSVLERSSGKTLISIVPVTGRKHQIRAQLSYIGHPILGDTLYNSSVKLSGNRICLFAKEITFLHPTKKIELHLVSPLPSGWPWEGFEKSSILPWLWQEFLQSKEFKQLVFH